MMKQMINHSKVLSVLGLMLSLTACSSTDEAPAEANTDANVVRFAVQHPGGVTRATDTSFETGDRVGVFLTDQNVPLDVAGNYVTNMPLSYDGTSWNMPQTVYWNDGTYDAYAYSPYQTPILAVGDLPVSVATDQRSAADYGQSDLLWAKTAGVSAGNGAVNLQFSHRMSRLMIRLVKGDDYEGELPDDAEVYVHNTVVTGTFDLRAGYATCDTHASGATIHARPLGNHRYTALVIPQRLDNRVPLVEVVMKGVSYLYESKFLFKPGIQHNVLLAVSHNPEQVKIQVGGEIENWSE